MKTKLLLTAILALALAPAPLRAASILSEISVSPVAAYEQAGFLTGPAQYGAGVDLGLPINKFVSLHVRNLAFEGDDHSWGGTVIDETTVYGRADFVSFAGEKFRLFGTGGGSRHWDRDDWSFGVGIGAEYRFTKHIAASVSREVRAFFKGGHDWLSVAALTYTF